VSMSYYLQQTKTIVRNLILTNCHEYSKLVLPHGTFDRTVPICRTASFRPDTYRVKAYQAMLLLGQEDLANPTNKGDF